MSLGKLLAGYRRRSIGSNQYDSNIVDILNAITYILTMDRQVISIFRQKE